VTEVLSYMGITEYPSLTGPALGGTDTPSHGLHRQERKMKNGSSFEKNFIQKDMTPGSSRLLRTPGKHND